ncbi:helix-turn-helix domain-containing protein [Brevibacillus sp. JB24b]|uniref:helix-turn-helix domain-containing protein n=1 Tax=Brevibacillus sp. JB24b TaxID=3422308 RepID=UPI003F68808B
MCKETVDSRRFFGMCLKSLRKNVKLSQEELAEQLQVSRTTIAKTEAGQNLPKSEFIAKAFLFFKSSEIIDQYFKVQTDRKELENLTQSFYLKDYQLARRVIKKLIRESLKAGDVEAAVNCVFQVMMWDLELRKKVNHRKIRFVINAFSDLEDNKFVDLLDSLYDISYKCGKQFDAFIRIVEVIKDSLNSDKNKLAVLMYEYATAHYYSGNAYDSYKISLKSLEYMGNTLLRKRANIFLRHALISLQLENFLESAEYFRRCYEEGNELLKRAALINLGRTYYLSGNLNEANVYWNKSLKLLPKHDLMRINIYTDMSMAALKVGDLKKAESYNRKTEELLILAKTKVWGMYDEEKLLLERNKALLNALKSNSFQSGDISMIDLKLKNSHLKDEYKITRNFILDKLLPSVTM